MLRVHHVRATQRAVVSPGRTLRLRRERNHALQATVSSAFPSGMRVHVMPRSKRQMAALPLVSQEALGT